MHHASFRCTSFKNRQETSGPAVRLFAFIRRGTAWAMGSGLYRRATLISQELTRGTAREGRAAPRAAGSRCRPRSPLAKITVRELRHLAESASD